LLMLLTLLQMDRQPLLLLSAKSLLTKNPEGNFGKYNIKK